MLLSGRQVSYPHNSYTWSEAGMDELGRDTWWEKNIKVYPLFII
jgi:hypothetical protein